MILDVRPSLLRGVVVAIGLTLAAGASAKEAADLVGTWNLTFDKTGAACRIWLRADKSDKGDYFLGLPPACRHAMPAIAAVGRWAMPDETHVTLNDPAGQPVVTLAASDNGFVSAGPNGTYTLQQLPSGRSAAGFEAVTPTAAPSLAQGLARVAGPATLAPGATPPAQLVPVQASTRRSHEPVETAADLAGRYAILRDKHDTGCMLTLDRTHGKGGDRAQLAPGCRDQGIVIFDPSAWQIVRGDLVLTARAGHKTKLEKQDDGVWAKDPKEGGKPLGLKKL